MEPRIQYARTADGVSIAYWTLGKGVPLVLMPDPSVSHIRLEWQNPAIRQWYERLAQERMIVRFDGRGIGLSDREVSIHSLEASVLDLEAVVNRLGLQKLGVFVGMLGGPVAIAFAARHPDKVSHLILWCTGARVSDFIDTVSFRVWEALLDVDWEMATEMGARAAPSAASDARIARQMAAFFRACTSREVLLAQIKAFREVDVTPLLPGLQSPTLVLSRRQIPRRDNVRLGRELASRIPNSRLVLLEGSSTLPFVGDMEAVLRAIDEFLGEGEEPEARGLAKEDIYTILFTDMEGSTFLTQRLGDARAQELLRVHNTIVREALKNHSGSEIKHTGDGIMASFPSASQALQCAISIQKAVAALEQVALRVRIGLNAGEPVAEERDLFGTAVQLAKRICDHAEPGQILAPIVVRELAAGKGFLFADIGETELRGFEDPVRLYEVRWQE